MPVYRYAPIRSVLAEFGHPRDRRVCSATSNVLPGRRSRLGFTAIAPRRSSPRSFIYHFAVKALLALIESHSTTYAPEITAVRRKWLSPKITIAGG